MSVESRVISHRGRSTGKRPNSIAAFEKALSLGATGIETDVRITGDKKAVVSHDSSIQLPSGGMIQVAESPLDLLTQGEAPNGKPTPTSELFNFIGQVDASFFIELKVPSHELVRQIANKIKDGRLWERVYLIGFSKAIAPALEAQREYERLRVIPFVNLPLAFIRPVSPSHGIFVGWLDDLRGSQTFFRTLISADRLQRLRERYEAMGFSVMAGVINKPEGVKYFKDAGINDVITDEIVQTKRILES